MSLRVEHLDKDYPTPTTPLSVLRDVSLEVQRGEAVAVMGPSGSGKSTLLHILGTLDRPTRGGVRLGDQDPFALSEPKLADFRNRSIGFVFQDHHLLPQCSVLENVLIPTLAGSHTNPKRERGLEPNPSLALRVSVASHGQENVKEWALKLLDRVGLSSRLNHRPAELSGGERQRVAVARALIHHPPLLLADEPTGNLDRVKADEIGRLLLDLHREEQTILVVVTHSRRLADLMPRVLVMDDGRLRPDTPADRGAVT